MLNEEVTEAIYLYLAVSGCVDVMYDQGASGRNTQEGIRFLPDAGNDRYHTYATSCQKDDMPDCVSEYYTNEQRVEEFMAGYNEVIPVE